MSLPFCVSRTCDLAVGGRNVEPVPSGVSDAWTGMASPDDGNRGRSLVDHIEHHHAARVAGQARRLGCRPAKQSTGWARKLPWPRLKTCRTAGGDAQRAVGEIQWTRSRRRSGHAGVRSEEIDPRRIDREYTAVKISAAHGQTLGERFNERGRSRSSHGLSGFLVSVQVFHAVIEEAAPPATKAKPPSGRNDTSVAGAPSGNRFQGFKRGINIERAARENVCLQAVGREVGCRGASNG